jgi:hypothetical protein
MPEAGSTRKVPLLDKPCGKSEPVGGFSFQSGYGLDIPNVE